MNWSFLCKKCPCWAMGLIKIVAITVLTFVIMTIYLQHIQPHTSYIREGYEDKTPAPSPYEIKGNKKIKDMYATPTPSPYEIKGNKKIKDMYATPAPTPSPTPSPYEMKDNSAPDFDKITKDIDNTQSPDDIKEQEKQEDEDMIASTTPFIPDKSQNLPALKPKPFTPIPPLRPIPPSSPPNIKAMTNAMFEQVNANFESAPMTLATLGVDMSNPRAKALNALLTERPSLDELLSKIEANRPKYGLVVAERPSPTLDEITSNYNGFFITQSEFVDVVKGTAYFRTMSKADLIARHGIDSNTQEPSADVYFATYVSSYQPFSNDQKYKLIQAIQKANTLLAPFPVLDKVKWKFAKIKNGMEMSYPHTLKDIIIMTDDFINRPLEEFTKTLIHEKFHVYQRQFANSVTDLVSRLDFVPLTSPQVLMIDYVLRALMRNNPDLDGAIYMYKPTQKVIAQIYNTSEPTNLADSKTVQLALNSYGRNSELLRVTNQALGLPDNFQCQLEHPYEISACLITEIIVNRDFYIGNKDNKYIKSCVEWIKRNLMQ